MGPAAPRAIFRAVPAFRSLPAPDGEHAAVRGEKSWSWASFCGPANVGLGTGLWKTSSQCVPSFVDRTGKRSGSCMPSTIYVVALPPPPHLAPLLFSSPLKNRRTSRAFDIQEKRCSAVNSPPNIQRSGSLLDKHSSSESDPEPTETSWKSHKIFFIAQT